MYDVAIVGAGINGCAVAHEFVEAGKRVLLLESEAVAAGGSGAAGAFISPKFSKSGLLKELLEEAFCYAMEYYAEHFPDTFTKTPLLHIAKDAADDAKLLAWKESTSLPLLTPDPHLLTRLTPKAKERVHLCIDAGVVAAKDVCRAMSQGATLCYEALREYRYEEDHWLLNNTHRAKVVVFATGAYKSLHSESYIKLRGVWGHRIDIETKEVNPLSIHQFVSIAPSCEGVVAIGATHNVHYHPQTSKEAYDLEAGRKELLQKAAQTLQWRGDEKVVADYTGLRSGSFDYLPLLGGLVDSKASLAPELVKKLKVKRPNSNLVQTHKDLYMINGSGGYGFVLAPLLAKKLYAHIEEGIPIEEELLPARFFLRALKRDRL